MMTVLCSHGFFLEHCLTCYKRDGQCDYGACEASATQVVETHRRGKLVETRRMCYRHAHKSDSALRSMTYRPITDREMI